MKKSQIRLLKSHYLARWAVMRHNQKNTSKELLILDQFVLKNLLPGKTLVHNCLGEMYNYIIPELSIKIEPGVTYNNLVLINNVEFKYKTVDQINSYLEELASVLDSKGRIIFSFEHRFLIYNRVELTIENMLNTFIKKLEKFNLIKMLNLFNKSQPGYGDYFFCIDLK